MQIKKKRIKFFILGLYLCSINSPSQAGKIEIPQDNLFVPHVMAKQARLSYDTDQNEFTAVLDGKQKKINKYDVSGLPSNISEKQIENLLKVAYFSLHQADEDLILDTNVRGLGGSGKGAPRPNIVPDAEEQSFYRNRYIASFLLGGGTGAFFGGPVGFIVGGSAGVILNFVGPRLSDKIPDLTYDTKTGKWEKK